MTVPAIISSFQSPARRWFILLMVFYAAVGVIGLRDYVELLSINFLLGIAALYFVINIQQQKPTIHFSYIAIAFALISLAIPIRTTLYFGVGAGLLFAIESFSKRSVVLPLVVLVFMSPIFKYLTNVFSFPIRLEMTSWAASILRFTGDTLRVEGNVIYNNGNEFSVDPECMGLNMMVTSLLLAVTLIALFQQRHGKRLALWQMGTLLAAVSLLNVVGNLARIICLVRFAILPGTFTHEATGIICFLVYVILPGVWCTSWLTKRFGKPVEMNDKPLAPVKITKSQLIKHGIVALCIGMAAINVSKHSIQVANASRPVPALSGYKVSRVDPGVLKFENKTSLVYAKPIPEFYSADHNPMVCWIGSGYAFRQVREVSINGISIYTALLQKGNEQLYTAWWYDNGLRCTIDQMAWRIDALKGSGDYFVVNVTAASEKMLYAEINEINRNKQFHDLLQSINRN